MEHRITSRWLLCFVSLAFTAPQLHAQPGTFDPSFGWMGTSSCDFQLTPSQAAFDMAVQPDGKVVLVGKLPGTFTDFFGVARFTSDGWLDTDFSNDGMDTVLVAVGGWDQPRSVALQPDGGIVVMGGAFGLPQSSTGLARFLPDGGLDTSFNASGRLIMPGITGAGITVQPDGMILLAGLWYNGLLTHTHLTRLKPDGSLDQAFDNDGTATWPQATSTTAACLALQADGAILTAGIMQVGATPHVLVERFTAGGQRDSTFGTNGIVTVPPYASQSVPRSMVVQPDGKVLVALQHWVGNDTYFGALRLNSDGTMDAGFNGGTPLFCAALDWVTVSDMVLDSDGRVVLVGSSYRNVPFPGPGWTWDLATVRLLPNGAYDPLWGTNGVLESAVGTGVDMANAGALANDGGVLVAGSINTSFLVVKYVGGTIMGQSTVQKEEPRASVSPNPAALMCSLQFQQSGSAASTCTLRDMAGRNVRTFWSDRLLPAGTRVEVLDLSGLVSGVYALEIRSGSRAATVRLVKE